MDYLIEHKQKPKSLLHEKYAFRYFKKLTRKRAPEVDEYHILNDDEVKIIQYIRRNTLFFAGLFGSLGIISLYIPYYLCPEIFWVVTVNIPGMAQIPIPIVFTIYGLVLAILEIAALVVLNLRTVHQIAFVCGFPSREDPDYEKHIETLFEVSLEKPNKQILIFGIDPLAGLSKFNIILFTTFNLLKASLSNVLIKMVLARVFGRYMLRAYIDLIGIPVFAFWNMYAANRVIREAKVRIMAPNMIRHLSYTLHKKLHEDDHFKSTLYDALQFIAVTKRNFHHNHFLLVESLIQVFEFELKKQAPLSREELIKKAESLNENAKQGLARLLIFGIMIDGNLSYREKIVLEELHREGLIRIDFKTLKVWEKSFLEGRGLNELLEAKII